MGRIWYRGLDGQVVKGDPMPKLYLIPFCEGKVELWVSRLRTKQESKNITCF